MVHVTIADVGQVQACVKRKRRQKDDDKAQTVEIVHLSVYMSVYVCVCVCVCVHV